MNLGKWVNPDQVWSKGRARATRLQKKAGTASIGRVCRGGNAGELPPFSFIRRIYQVQSCYTKL